MDKVYDDELKGLLNFENILRKNGISVDTYNNIFLMRRSTQNLRELARLEKRIRESEVIDITRVPHSDQTQEEILINVNPEKYYNRSVDEF